MTDKTLFLAWQDTNITRGWFPIGRLDVANDSSLYKFRYVQGAKRAHEESNFEPLYDFPDFDKTYESKDLFPMFQNRVLSKSRKDFSAYLQQLNLSSYADAIEILSVDGGYRATDDFEVFPKVERAQDGAFRCRFFLHGWSHVSKAAQQRLDFIESDEKLYVAVELTNPTSHLGIQIQTTDYHMLGWAPRYLVKDLVKAIAESPGDYLARAVQVNPAPAPSKQRLLVELSGHWPNHEPMTQDDFALIEC